MEKSELRGNDGKRIKVEDRQDGRRGHQGWSDNSIATQGQINSLRDPDEVNREIAAMYAEIRSQSENVYGLSGLLSMRPGVGVTLPQPEIGASKPLEVDGAESSIAPKPEV